MKEEIRLLKILPISFLIICLTMGIVIGFYSYNNFDKALTKHVHFHLQTAAESKANHVEMFLHENKQTILTFSDDVVFLEVLTTDKSDFDYKERFERANKQLTSMVEINAEFNEAFILDLDGKIIATSQALDEISTDFSEDIYFIEGKKGFYVKDAHYNENLKEKSIGMSAPVLDDETNELKGVIVAEVSLKELVDIMTRRTGLGETGETYVVNKDKFLITPSRFIENSIMVQKVDTENSQKCLVDIEEYIFKKKVLSHAQHNYENDPIKFLDYRGEKVLGAHAIVPEMNWCVLAEMDEVEALGIPQKQFGKNQVIVSVITIFSITITGFFAGMFLDMRYSLARGRNLNEK